MLHTAVFIAIVVLTGRLHVCNALPDAVQIAKFNDSIGMCTDSLLLAPTAACHRSTASIEMGDGIIRLHNETMSAEWIRSLRRENTELRARLDAVERSLTSLSALVVALSPGGPTETVPTPTAMPTPTANAPPVCAYDGWSSWSLCTEACDGGVHTRTRDLLTPSCGNPGLLTETSACNTHTCPVDCRVSNFTTFGPCSTTCGGGVSIRSRVVLVPPIGGAPCPALVESIDCNTHVCNVSTCDGGEFATLAALARLSSCDIINGNVTIHSISDAYQLADYVPVLTQINGALSLFSTSGLTAFGPLALTHVLGSLELTNLDGLQSLAGLEALRVIGHALAIDDCRNLNTLTSLAALESIGSHLIVNSNDNLLNIGAFPSLSSVGGNLTISDCPLLVSTEGLSHLSFITDSLYLHDNPSLATLGNFSALTTAGSLSFSLLPALLAIPPTAFPVLTSLSGSLVIDLAGPRLPQLSEIVFPTLSSIANAFSLSSHTESSWGLNSPLHTLAFPVLAHLGSLSFHITNPVPNTHSLNSLTSIEFPALRQVASSIRFSLVCIASYGCNILRNVKFIAFPLLDYTSTFELALSVSNQRTANILRACTSLNLDSLRAADLISIATLKTSSAASFHPDYPQLVLTNISLPSLTSVGDFTLTSQTDYGLYTLRTLHLPQLAFVNGSFAINYDDLVAASLFTTIDLPSLVRVDGSFSIAGVTTASLPLLHLPTLPSLQSLSGSYSISTAFLASPVSALMPNLTFIGGSFTLSSIGGPLQITQGLARLERLLPPATFTLTNCNIGSFPVLSALISSGSITIHMTDLTSLNLFSVIQLIEGDVTLTDNSRATICQSSIARYTAAATGTTTISGYALSGSC